MNEGGTGSCSGCQGGRQQGGKEDGSRPSPKGNAAAPEPRPSTTTARPAREVGRGKAATSTAAWARAHAATTLAGETAASNATPAAEANENAAGDSTVVKRRHHVVGSVDKSDEGPPKRSRLKVYFGDASQCYVMHCEVTLWIRCVTARTAT